MFSLSPGGESGAQLRERVVPAIEGALGSIGGGVVVMVTHGGVINAYVGHVMGVPHDMFFGPDNTSISTIAVDGESREVRFLNDVRHLTDPQVFAPPAAVGSHSSPWPASGPNPPAGVPGNGPRPEPRS